MHNEVSSLAEWLLRVIPVFVTRGCLSASSWPAASRLRSSLGARDQSRNGCPPQTDGNGRCAVEDSAGSFRIRRRLDVEGTDRAISFCSEILIWGVYSLNQMALQAKIPREWPRHRVLCSNISYIPFEILAFESLGTMCVVAAFDSQAKSRCCS